jgi:hypothetical protein
MPCSLHGSGSVWFDSTLKGLRLVWSEPTLYYCTVFWLCTYVSMEQPHRNVMQCGSARRTGPAKMSTARLRMERFVRTNIRTCFSAYYFIDSRPLQVFGRSNLICTLRLTGQSSLSWFAAATRWMMFGAVARRHWSAISHTIIESRPRRPFDLLSLPNKTAQSENLRLETGNKYGIERKTSARGF